MSKKIECPHCKMLEGRLVAESNKGDKIYNCKHCRGAWTVEKITKGGKDE